MGFGKMMTGFLSMAMIGFNARFLGCISRYVKFMSFGSLFGEKAHILHLRGRSRYKYFLVKVDHISPATLRC